MYYERYCKNNEKPAPGAEIPFRDGRNFRELGGYESADGRHVKYGVFFRGIATGNLKSEADIALLDSMNLKFLLDLRAKSESASCPDYIPAGAEYVRICGMWAEKNVEMDFSPEQIEKMQKASAKDMEKSLRMIYGGMPIDNPAFRRLFQEIVKGNTPLMYHCSAGKDRTGIGSILILLALGVPVETALDDYVLTNTYRKAIIEADLKKNEALLKAHPEAYDALAGKEGVNPRFAQMAIQVMLEKYGTFEKYFEEEMGLSESDLKELRDRYLE